MMAVANALGPRGDIAGRKLGLAIVLDQDRLARQHDQQLVLALVPVALARPGAGLQDDMAGAKSVSPLGRRDLALPAAGDRLVERRRIAGAVGLLDGVEIDLGHGRAT